MRISWVFVGCFVGIRCVFRGCSLHFRNPLAMFWQSVSNVLANRSQRNGRPSAAVGADLSCPHIRIRHAFAICSEYIHVMFATCSLSVCYIFAMQKYGFCATKVWFLACKKWVFALQKYGFCKALISRWLHCFCVSGRCSNTINVRNRRYS